MSDIPADIDQAATRIASKYLTLDISCERLYHDVVWALIAERSKARNAALEEAAKTAERHATFPEEAIKAATSSEIMENSFGVTKSRLARQIAAAIRALREEE